MSRHLWRLLAAITVFGGMALVPRAEAQTPTPGGSKPRHVGCPLPSAIPDSVARNRHFQAQLYRWSERTYPVCNIPAGTLAGAYRDWRSMPASSQYSWGATSGRAPARLNPTLSDGIGETPWTSIGPVGIGSQPWGTVSGHVEALAVDPTNASVIYAGASSGGVWKTTDGGAHWIAPAASELTPAIGALAVDPTNPTTIYAGTGYGIYENEGEGLLKSTDGGSTWTLLGAPRSFGWMINFNKLVVDPTTSAVLWAAASNGVFKSTDAGATWSGPLAGLPSSPSWDLALDPGNHNTVYASFGQNLSSTTSAGIYRSTDGGSTWSLLGSGPNGNTATPGGSTHVGVVRLAFARVSSGSILYATVEDPTNATLYGAYRSSDGGATWTVLANPDPPSGSSAGTQYWYDDVLGVDPGDTTGQTVWVGGIDVFRTTNGGTSWTRATDVYGTNTQHLHPDQHAFAFAGTALYVGNDGGVYATSDGGTTWSNDNATLDITEFYGASSDAQYAPKVLGGAQDNGTSLWGGSASSLRWQLMMGGDGGENAVDYNNPQTYYAEWQNAGISASTNGGSTWSYITNNGITDSQNACFIAPIRMDQTNPQRLLTATSEVYQTTNGGTTWTPMSPDLTGGTGCITALAMAPSDGLKTLYASTSNGKVWVTSDGGSAWSDITGTLPSFWRSSIAVAPHNPQVAYLTGGWCTGGGCVWKTSNRGASWTDLTGNLPRYICDSILVDPVDSSHLYLGTDLGAYESLDDGVTWTKLSANMPPAAVHQLSLNRSGTILTAATYGRGMYQLYRSWLTLSSPSGAAGTLLTVSGYGFRAGESVTATFNGASVATTTASSSGTSAATVTVPALAAGSYTVSLQGASSGRSATGSFTIPAGVQSLIPNGGFESGQAPWQVYSASAHQIVSTLYPHVGAHSAALCGSNNCVDAFWQTVTVPTTLTGATLSFWLASQTGETGTACNDVIYLLFLTPAGAVIQPPLGACNLNTHGAWAPVSADVSSYLSAYKGQQVTMMFLAATNASLPSSYFIDDVAVTATVGAGPSPSPATSQTGPLHPAPAPVCIPLPNGKERCRPGLKP